MATIAVGETVDPIYQTSQPLSKAADGTGSSSITFKINGAIADNLSTIPDYLDDHPYITELKAYESQVDQEEGPITVCTTVYKGVIAADPDELAQYEFDRATTEAPVETHPRFAVPIAAPPVSASEIASIELSLQNNEPPSPTLGTVALELYNLKRRGIESYLKPGQIFKKTYVSADIPSGATIDDVGKIKEAPFPAPESPEGQNYLYLGASWKKQAGVVTIVESYQLSGPGGWNTTLYESA